MAVIHDVVRIARHYFMLLTKKSTVFVVQA